MLTTATIHFSELLQRTGLQSKPCSHPKAVADYTIEIQIEPVIRVAVILVQHVGSSSEAARITRTDDWGSGILSIDNVQVKKSIIIEITPGGAVATPIDRVAKPPGD